MKNERIQPWLFLAILVLSTMLIGFACTRTMQLKGHSMEPTVKDGEKITVDASAFEQADPQRGEIILYEYDGNKRISRVIGLPGETIGFIDGAVYVDGNKLDEPYLTPGIRTESPTKEYQVPDDSYFVLADNRGKASDSLSIGFISRASIVAKVLR
jgi:signal peptidase I